MSPTPTTRGRRPLTVALLTHSFRLPKWQLEALLQLQLQGVVTVVRIVAAGRGTGWVERCFRDAVSAVEKFVYRNPERPDIAVDVRNSFPGVEVDDGSAPPAEPVRLRADLAVNGGLGEAVIGRYSTRLGTLTCKFGGAPGEIGMYRALMRGRRDLSIAAQLSNGNRLQVLAQAWPALPARPLFHEASLNVCRRASALLVKAVRELSSGEPPIARTPASMAVYPEITVPALCGYASRRCFNSLKERTRRWLQKPTWVDRESNWFLAYRTNRDYFVCNTERFNAHGFQLILPPRDHFYADPCVIEHEGMHHVFLEDWNVGSGKGDISWMRMEQGRPTTAEKVLERPYHLSYPFVLKVGNDFFMIPETASARRIELYKAVDFPTRWEPVEILLDRISGADATFCQHDGRWWMFVTVGEEGSSRSDQLFLYHADSVWGPWRPHRRNPVKMDVRSSRPAGRLFRRGGKLLRPTQDCSTRYGGALTLCEVRDLSLRDYAELEVETLQPDWLASNIGFHTLSHCDSLEVIDGKMLPGKLSRFPVGECAGAWNAETRPSLADHWQDNGTASLAVPPSRIGAGR